MRTLRPPVMVAALTLACSAVVVGVVLMARPDGGQGADPVLTRIGGETVCSTLQEEFNRGDVAHDRAQAVGDEAGRQQALGWMEAAHGRMQAVGCYG